MVEWDLFCFRHIRFQRGTPDCKEKSGQRVPFFGWERETPGMNHEAHRPGFPKLRLLDLRPYKDEEREGLLLIDRNGLFEDPVFVPAELLPILGALTGERDSREIAEDLGREMGYKVPVSLVEQVVEMLDSKLCLEGERAERASQERREAYLALDRRPALFPGTPGYPSDPARLREELDRILAEGAGVLGNGELRGLVAPHIDFARGREGYAAAYGRLFAEERLPELLLVFGTGHAGPSTLLVPSTKDYETPLGALATDEEFVKQTLEAFPELAAEEHLHEKEHSLEFQAVFLAHVFARHPSGAVPHCVFFLTGRLGEEPDEDPGVQGLLDFLEERVRASSKRTLLLAGADLSHVGPVFGDAEPVDQDRVARLEAADLADLEKARSLRLGDFVAGLQRAEAERRVCGTTPIYLLGRLAQRLAGEGELEGRVLRYGASHEPGGGQCVTWASLAYEAGNRR
ncbi:MAG TPA: AmmeMemoRadiSam system protein B [Planctomycetes bacterium]|nr:AmmeMemoRadiSam system protein B [Planctomycetota bacterium]